MSSAQPELQSSISANYFLHIPNRLPRATDRGDKFMIFFIPGNPGLVSYYRTFLSVLAESKTSPSTSSCVIAGFSLGGFEILEHSQDRDEVRRVLFPEKGPRGPLYSLQDQIKLTTARLESLVEVLQGQTCSGKGFSDGRPGKGWRVILIGHSVGAYIALEVLRLHRQKPSRNGSAADLAEPKITAALLLTPTIVNIALSSNGKVLAPLLKYCPGFPLLVSLGAGFISRLLRESWLATLVRTVMGRDTPDDAVASTICFLTSKMGIQQCLSMAANEMEEIGEDQWEDEVWGVADASKGDHADRGVQMSDPARLIFYFARQDHWVADQTREAIIKTRGGGRGMANSTMMVAEEGELVHGWCIKHSRVVAQKVNQWVEEIIHG